jgi:hypothetical protein
MSTFANMKKDRKSMMDTVRKAVESSQNETQSFQDDRFWYPERDKGGNGFAVVRFLPQSEGETVPWIKYWDHGFQGSGGWFIENCLTSINKKCPACEFNTSLWNSGVESDKDIARKQKRRLRHVSNIYVVYDPSNPQNEGKVMLYRYGKKIYDKLSEAMNPEFKDEVAFNPFDLWEGADLKLKIRKVDGWPNYDRSEFDERKPLFGTDSELEEVWKQQYKLEEFLSDEKFKTYEELQVSLARALGQSKDIGTVEDNDTDLQEEVVLESPSTKFSRIEKKVETPELNIDTDAGEEKMDYFARLAEDNQ